MKKTLRLGAIALCLLLLCGLLAACNSPAPLPEWANSEDLRAKSEAVLDDLSARDYEATTLHFKEEYQAGISVATWQEQFDPIFDELGAFEEYTKIEMQGLTQDDIEYAVVLVTCKYENGTLRFTLTYDSDSDLVGLFA